MWWSAWNPFLMLRYIYLTRDPDLSPICPRTFVYPFLMRGRPFPVAVLFKGFVFCTGNGLLQGYYLTYCAEYPAEWYTDIRFILGKYICPVFTQHGSPLSNSPPPLPPITVTPQSFHSPLLSPLPSSFLSIATWENFEKHHVIHSSAQNSPMASGNVNSLPQPMKPMCPWFSPMSRLHFQPLSTSLLCCGLSGLPAEP